MKFFNIKIPFLELFSAWNCIPKVFFEFIIDGNANDPNLVKPRILFLSTLSAK
jgi:hypothetical protein